MLKALIVEDDKALADIIARYLQPVIGTPYIATTMKDALEVISTVPVLDIITLDLVMPDSTREESLARINEFKTIKPDALLIVVTGSMQPDQEGVCIEAGADGFMHKADAMRSEGGFLNTFCDVVRSIARKPKRYQKNLPLMEALAEKVQECANEIRESVTNQQPTS